MPDCETLFLLAENAMRYYKASSEIKEQRLDTMTKAIKYLLSIKGLNYENERDLAVATEGWAALDKASKDEIIRLTKDNKKLTRRKNFWKWTALIFEPIAITVAAIFILK